MALSILVILTLLLFMYVLLKRYLLDLVQPKRLEMADLGNNLLACDELTDCQKDLVTDMLDDAYDGRYMAYATFMFPVVFFRSVIFGRKKKAGLDTLLKNKDFERFMELHRASTSAANPVFALFFNIEVAFAFLVLFTFLRVGLVPLLLLFTIAGSSRYVHGGRLLKNAQ